MEGDVRYTIWSALIALSFLMLGGAVFCIIKAQLVLKKEPVEKLHREAKEVCEAINAGNKKALHFAQEQLKDKDSPYHYLISLECGDGGCYTAQLTQEAGYVPKRVAVRGILKQDIV